MDNISVVLGSGDSTMFWQDKWVHKDICPESWFPDDASLVERFVPVSNFVNNDNMWDMARLHSLLPNNIVMHILAIPIPSMSDGPDGYAWGAQMMDPF